MITIFYIIKTILIYFIPLGLKTKEDLQAL